MLDQPFMTDIIEASSISHMPQLIDIYSASWGPTDNGKTVDGPRELTLQAMADGVNKVKMSPTPEGPSPLLSWDMVGEEVVTIQQIKRQGRDIDVAVILCVGSGPMRNEQQNGFNSAGYLQEGTLQKDKMGEGQEMAGKALDCDVA
jgi:hypothetical protein